MDRPRVCHMSDKLERDSVHQCTYVESRKNGTDKPICSIEIRCRHREWMCGHELGEGGWGESGDWNCHIYTTLC